MSILVTDFGTSAVKSFLYEAESGRIIGSDEVETPTYTPEPGAYESDAEDWLEGFLTTASTLIAAHPEHPVEAIAITNQQISCVLLDADEQPVHRALLWADSRSTDVLSRLRGEVSAELAETDFGRWFSDRTGLPYSDRWGVAKALWLRDRHPEAFARATRISSVDAYIALALTGRYASDVSNATFFSLDIRSGEFNHEVLSRFGIGPEYFPETVPAGSVIGPIRDRIAARLGLAGPVPLIISGSDQPCSMVGSGAVRAGDVVINLGSGSFVTTSMPSAVTDTRIMTNFSVLEDHWVAMGTHYLTGAAFRWLRDTLGWQQDVTYDQLDAAAGATPPGADGLIFIPSLTGSGTPDWRSDAKGLMAGLSIEHTPGHLARAVMESTGYGLKLILETLDQLGIEIGQLLLTGGATVSSGWTQTITDILGREVTLPSAHQATARGALLIALVALGKHPDLESALAAFENPASMLVPSPDTAGVYAERYRDYLYWKDAENAFRDARAA